MDRAATQPSAPHLTPDSQSPGASRLSEPSPITLYWIGILGANVGVTVGFGLDWTGLDYVHV